MCLSAPLPNVGDWLYPIEDYADRLEPEGWRGWLLLTIDNGIEYQADNGVPFPPANTKHLYNI